MIRTVALAGGTPASVAGLPMRAAYCAMLQVSAKAGSVAGAVVGGAGSTGAGVAAAAGSTGAEGAGSVDGEHAISATPATTARNVFFMPWRVVRFWLHSSEPSVSLRVHVKVREWPVWLRSPQLKPLMQMPAGAGTFMTVPEQIEVLQLVQ